MAGFEGENIYRFQQTLNLICGKRNTNDKNVNVAVTVNELPLLPII